jgi:hypothetical protein
MEGFGNGSVFSSIEGRPVMMGFPPCIYTAVIFVVVFALITLHPRSSGVCPDAWQAIACRTEPFFAGCGCLEPTQAGVEPAASKSAEEVAVVRAKLSSVLDNAVGFYNQFIWSMMIRHVNDHAPYLPL